MVKLINGDSLSKYENIIIYGAGVIGKIVMPYYIVEHNLVGKILCYIDKNTYIQNEKIKIKNKEIEVKSPSYLQKLPSNTLIIVTTSNYSELLNIFDSYDYLNSVDVLIAPIVLAENAPTSGEKRVTSGKMETKIPKKIHYCWFSRNPMPDYLEFCIESWKKYCPDYEIIRWDEDNYDVEKNQYMKQAYSAKKWGFVPDIARLDILYNHGGLYIDTDVEIIKNLDDLLVYEAFAGVEKWGNINMGGCSGAIPKHPMIKKMLDFRKNELFIRQDGSMNLTTCGYYETSPLIEMGFKPNNTVQTIEGMTIFSSDYFHPYDYMSGETRITENTYSIHHFNGGWIDDKHKMEREKTKSEYKSILKRIKA